MKTPVWNLDRPEDKVTITNGNIEISKPGTYKDTELKCSFIVDASADFSPPGKFSFKHNS